MQLHSFSIFRGLICGWLVITLVVAQVRNKFYYMYFNYLKYKDFAPFFKDERTKRQVYQPPQVDEKLVSAFINNPEAVKMVMSYLKKQTTPAPRTTARTSPPRRQRPRRPPPPPLSFFFGGKKPLSQLLQEHRDTVKHLKATPTPTAATPGVVKGLLGPPLEALAGRLPDEDKDMQFFGPKDFVPKKAYQPPLGPMRLRYATTQEFPSRTYGRLVPMPR